ncbi:MAG: xanthine dehydrogenase family protein molybdopterin-binding subunit [Bacteroidales bacterium]|nr:xanthine dehydrogenase family protein molybdopterin-binding subunit [Bacteroidales bacterium]
MQSINQSIKRIDALDKVTGAAKYPGDFDFENQLYMKILFSDRVHAVVKEIDVSKAEALNGVVAVFTAKDVPNNEYGLIMPDQPVLCGPGSNKKFGDRVRCLADQVALVVAETEEIAEEARKLINVTYLDLQAVTNVHKAMASDEILIHPDHNSNIINHYKVRKGETTTAFEKAHVIVESDYDTPIQEHAYLQPEAGVSYVEENGRIAVIVGGQWTHEDQKQVAHALELPLDNIRIIYPAIGGAFGGREDMSVQIVLALASYRLQQKGITRPIKIIWSREESIIGHHKRHPYAMKAKWGATKEGKIIAAEIELVADGGAYAYTSTKVQGNATMMCSGPYEIDNINIDSYSVYTNNIPNGAFRGFGGPQATFLAELQIDKLAEKLGMDPVEIRMLNLLKQDSLTAVQSPMPDGLTIDKVIEDCALASGWKKENGKWQFKKTLAKPDKPYLRRGIGFGCAFKNVGFSYGAPEECWAVVELHGDQEINKVVLRHAAAEVGQGVNTALTQMAAEAVGVSIAKVTTIIGDTATSRNSGSVSASRMTFMSGNSVKGAVELALKKWKEEERPAIAEYRYVPPKTTKLDAEDGHCIPNFSYGYVAESVEIEVDIETGELRIVNVICSDDVGKAINPQQIEGQIEGAVVQSAGYALMENYILKEGRPLTTALSTYLIPTVLDIPDNVESRILEYPDPIGPWGATGMGEMPYLPLTPAIASAIHQATGVWINEFPFTAERIAEALDGD